MSDVPVPHGEETILSGYKPPSKAYDEVFVSAGQPRPAWQKLLEGLQGLRPAELARRWSRAQDEIRDNGVAQSVHRDEPEDQRPWPLDALPLPTLAREWDQLAAGLAQRARLLDLILRDLCGAQQLLTSGVLPAEWLFSHPGFRRRYCRPTSTEHPRLGLYAADLVRAPNGQWWIVGDRTDTPFGLGYALENRVATSRIFPNLFRECQVERLAQFFITFSKTLHQLAPHHRENPRIVLLSQGSDSANHLEDAYLARYLGYTLVEGGDLAVRDDHVFLKTLSGLLPVDVIWRRLSDEYCDPLEVRGGIEQLGVPGLLHATRLGHVAVINDFGTSIVEAPSLRPFLPAIARHLLGEELQLPSVATWWCGQATARDAVRHRRDELLFRPAYRIAGRGVGPLGADPARQASGDLLAQALKSDPASVVGLERIERSVAPVWTNGSAEAAQVALRVFLVSDGGSYRAMPGGLVRVARAGESLDESVLNGSACKDAWVLSTTPVRQVSLLPTSREPIVLQRSGADVPSRVADNLFWFGRRMERAQGACRLLRPVVACLIGEENIEDLRELPTLVHCLAANGLIEPGFALDTMRDLLPNLAQTLPTALLDDTLPGNLRTTIEQAYLNASLVRDRLSLDSWRVVHRIGRTFALAAGSVKDERRQLQTESTPVDDKKMTPLQQESQAFELVELDNLLDELIVDFGALDGLFAESMTRTPAWRFLDLGRRLERALYTASLVQSLLSTAPPDEGRVLEAVLRVADSLMTYRNRYLAAVHMATTLDLLITDDTNPRSLVFQLAAIARHIAALPRGASQPLGTPEERMTSSLVHAIRMLDVDDLRVEGEGQRTKLERIVLRVADQLPKLSDLVSQRYFIHAGRPRQFAEGRVSHP